MKIRIVLPFDSMFVIQVQKKFVIRAGGFEHVPIGFIYSSSSDGWSFGLYLVVLSVRLTGLWRLK